MAANFGAASTSVQHPAPNARAAISYEPLREGDAGTRQTLEAMARAVRGQIPPDFSGYLDPTIRATALFLTYNVTDPIWALFRFVRDDIAYLEHPPDMQVVQDARRTISLRRGDCVSKTVCLATLLATRGYFSRFVAQDEDGQGFSHVYLEVKDGLAWVALDPVADGLFGRPLGGIGWRNDLPASGFELYQSIF